MAENASPAFEYNTMEPWREVEQSLGERELSATRNTVIFLVTRSSDVRSVVHNSLS